MGWGERDHEAGFQLNKNMNFEHLELAREPILVTFDISVVSRPKY